MENYDLSKVHEANLKIMEAVDEICRRHHLTYMLEGGTLIGAVRHKGFIPWDDDMDIDFRREQFEEFVKYKDELPDTMELVMPNEFQGGRVFYDYVPRIIYRNSRRRDPSDAMEQFYEGKLNHLWVDIFIIDYVPDSAFGTKMMQLRQLIAFGLGMGHRQKLDFSKYHGINLLGVRVLSAIGRWLPMPYIFRLQKKWASSVTERVKKGMPVPRKSFWSNYQPDFMYCLLPNEWADPVIEYRFEGRAFFGPNNWDAILTMLYGDYRKLPPESERVPSHSGREIEVFDE